MAFHTGEIAIVALEGIVIVIDLGIHRGGNHLTIIEVDIKFFFVIGAYGVKVLRRQERSRPHRDGFGPFEDHFLKLFVKAAGRLADHAFEEINHGAREGQILAFVVDVFGGQAVLDHEDGQIADNLGRRCNLYDVT